MSVKTTLASLVTVRTRDEVLTEILADMATRSFPTTSWAETSVPKRLLYAFAETIARLDRYNGEVTRGGILELASGTWLTLVAEGLYGLTRIPAVQTIGNIKVQDYGGGPHTYSAGQLIFATAGGKCYTNVSGGTITLSGTATISCVAEQGGTAWNVAQNDITVMQTPLPGVSYQSGKTSYNPDAVWITTSGANEESDTELKRRCELRWAQLSPLTASGIEALAVATPGVSTSVTRSKVLASFGGNAGSLICYIAGAAGAMGAGDVTLVNAYVLARLPYGVTGPYATPNNPVVSASNVSITTTGTIYAYSAYAATAQASAYAALDEYYASCPIGGTLYRDALIDVIRYSNTEVRNVILTTPSPPPASEEINIDDDEVPVRAGTLTVVAV